jgi:hypothetical protein
MKNSATNDWAAAVWFLLVLASGFLLFSWPLKLLGGPSWWRISFSLALALALTRLLVLFLWALSERLVLNPKRDAQRLGFCFFYVFIERFSGLAKDLLLMPTLRWLFLKIAGNKSISPRAILGGSFKLDLYSYLSIGAGTFVSADVEFINLCPVDGYQAKTEIGKNVIIQFGVIIEPGVKIGDNAVIGAGAILERNSVIPDNAEVSPKAVFSNR